MRLLLSFGLILFALSVAQADEPVLDDKPALIERRTADIQRTVKRIKDLVVDTKQVTLKLKSTELDAIKLEDDLGSRARFMYKINRRGGSFRYLLAADSVTTLLRRANTLKRLINDELVTLRDKGRTIAELQNRLASNDSEIQKAQEMLTMLKQTLTELKAAKL